MARALFPLTPNVWQDLGTSNMLVTLHQTGDGTLNLNSAQDIPTSLKISNGRPGVQFENNVPIDTISALATGAGWILAVELF